jgi:ABC-type Mn2+/Zn2+ transport system ATPase subunit
VAPPAVQIRGADCGYPGRGAVLRGADLVIGPGGFVGAVGPSGSGKTTLIRALTGQCRLLAGSVRVFGEPVRRGRPCRQVGYVPQVGTVDPAFPITVEQVATQGLGGRPPPWPDRRQRAIVAALLDRLGLSGLARRPIGELSGGELQRTFLARALVRRPRLLLLDEPTSGVDLKTRHDILHLLADLNADGITILLTTHDLNFVAAHLPRVVCLAGRVVADGTPEQVLRPPVLREAYGAEVRVIRDGDLVFVADPTHLLTGHRRTAPPWPG